MAERNDKVLASLDGKSGAENGTNGIETFDPNSVAIGNDSDTGNGGDSRKRRPGRPSGTARKPGSGNSRTSNATKSSTKNSSAIGLEQIFFSIHMMMSGATKIDELKLSQDEAKQLANAVAEVNSHYNVAIDPKVMAWVGLSTTCVSIYAPRLAAYKFRANLEEKKRKESEKTLGNATVKKAEAPQKGLQPAAEILPMSQGVPT